MLIFDGWKAVNKKANDFFCRATSFPEYYPLHPIQKQKQKQKKNIYIYRQVQFWSLENLFQVVCHVLPVLFFYFLLLSLLLCCIQKIFAQLVVVFQCVCGCCCCFCFLCIFVFICKISSLISGRVRLTLPKGRHHVCALTWMLWGVFFMPLKCSQASQLSAPKPTLRIPVSQSVPVQFGIPVAILQLAVPGSRPC